MMTRETTPPPSEPVWAPPLEQDMVTDGYVMTRLQRRAYDRWQKRERDHLRAEQRQERKARGGGPGFWLLVGALCLVGIGLAVLFALWYSPGVGP